MKTSTLSVIVLSVLLLCGAIVCDFILAAKYRTIDLNDPYKNFRDVAVKPFKELHISGGNGYAIAIRQGKDFNIKLMDSRKSFFKMQQSGDTLSIQFAVANQTYQKPTDCITGLIITFPSVSTISLSGTNNEIGPFLMDSLVIVQNARTMTRMNGLTIHRLNLQGYDESTFDCRRMIEIGQLSVSLKGRSEILMHDINFEKFRPVISDSATVVFYKKTLGGFVQDIIQNKN